MSAALFRRAAGRMRLTARLNIAMAAAMLIGTAVMLVTSIIQQKEHFSQELHDYLNEEMNTLQVVLSDPVVTGDYATIEKVLDDTIKSIRIRSAIYADLNGDRIVARDKPVISPAPRSFIALVGMPAFSKTGTITIGGRNYGTVTIKLTAIPAINYMWSSLIQNLQILLLELALLIAVTMVIVRHSLRPLDDLAAGARRIGGGDYETVIAEHGASEIVLTISAFNRMTQQLRQTLDQLKQSRDRYSILYNQTPVLLHSIDQTGTLVEVNDYWLKVLGYERDEVIGRKVTDFFTGSSRRHAQDIVQPEFFRKGICRNIAYQFVRKNGELVDVLLSATGERDASGNVIRSLAVIEDITERKRAEEKYRLLFESANDGIFIQDEKGFTDCNRKGASMYGLAKEQIIGRPPSEFAPERQPDGRLSSEVAAEKGRAALSGVPQVFEWQPVRAGGTPFDVEITLSRLELGGKIYLQAIVRDITERKRAEEEHEKLQAQLHQSQKMESVGRLAGGVAHDFNNMLTAILGYAEMAMTEGTPPHKMRSYLKVIEQSALRSAELVRQLLAFARKQSAAPKVLDLNQTVPNLLRMLRPLIGEEIDVSYVPGQDLWPVRIDPSQIDQVLANLCVNARGAIVGVGKITIETENVILDKAHCDASPGSVPGEYVMLAVGDNGCGMSKEVLEHIFEPFFTTKEAGLGTGLGLATVYGIVKQNDGLINVHSEPGRGTTFRIYLPRHAGEAPATAAAGQGDPEEGRGETVLPGGGR